MLLISLFTLVLGIIIANLASDLIKRIIRKTRSHKAIKKTFNTKFSLDTALANLTKIIIYIITLITILTQLELGIKKSLLIFAIVILALIALSFKDTTPNILAGIYIKLFKKIKLEQKIKTKELQGTVKKITLFETRVLTNKKELISIPNINLLRPK